MRTWRVLGSLLVLGMIIALPAVGYAQDSVMTGTVTDERGNFRLPVRIGNYRINAELTGFATVNRTTQMLVGQTGVVNFQLAPSTLQETVTVTSEAPLVNTATSGVGANIDPRQMSELPLNGRNWMDLSLLAPGARRNESGAGGGGLVQNRQGYAQTKMDGQ